VRKVISDFHTTYEGRSIGEVLLTPTKIYVKPILSILEKYTVKGMAHITGGGLPENLPRTISPDHQAVVWKNKIPVPQIFRYIQKAGKIAEEEMYGTFNMGVGFVLVVKADEKEGVLTDLHKLGETAWEIGYVRKGAHQLCFE
jgi:phosphoribosylformylglycinamidine cyclo-ligase